MENQSNTMQENHLEMSVLAKIFGIFTEPKRVFASLDHKPDFIIPLVILMITAFIFTFIGWPMIEKATISETMERLENSGLSEEQIDQQISIVKSAGKYSGLAGSVVAVLIIALVVSGILLFCGNIVIGGDSTYKKVLAVFSYASLVDFPSYILRLILMLGKETMFIYLSPAAFLSVEAKDSLLFKIAAIFDIFIIWKVILLGIGMAVLYKTSNRKSFAVVIILYLVFGVLSVAFSGMGGIG
jgi:hypothetical protein